MFYSELFFFLCRKRRTLTFQVISLSIYTLGFSTCNKFENSRGAFAGVPGDVSNALRLENVCQRENKTGKCVSEHVCQRHLRPGFPSP